jgi:hypothetical protein
MNSIINPISKEEVQRIWDLEYKMEGLPSVLFFIAIAVTIISVLYTQYPDVFVAKFGYSIILTIILIFIFFGIWSFYASYKKTYTTGTMEAFIANYSKIPLFIAAILILSLIFGIIYLLGIFTTPFKNNLGLLINYIIILILLVGTGFVFKKSSTNDEQILEKMPKHIQKFYTERKKYMMIFFVFMLFIIGLYLYNPSGFMTKYGGATAFISIFMGIALLLIVIGYDKYYNDPVKASAYEKYEENWPNLFKFFKGFYILFGLGISALFFYWIIYALGFLDQNEDKSNTEYIIKIIVNLVIFIGIFSFIYKTVNAGGYFSSNPLFRLIFNTILYIPCLLVIILDFIVDLFSSKPVDVAAANAVTAASTLHGATTDVTSKSSILGTTTKNDFLFLGLSVTVCGLYILLNYIIIPYGMKKYYNQDGLQLVNNPIPTNVLTNVASYETLNNSGLYNYRFALSFWFYIDSFPPSTSESYLKPAPILSYGDNPCVKYYSRTNSIIITVKQKTENADIVSSIQNLESNIKTENIEKWNKFQDKIKSGIEMVKSLPISNEHDENGNRIIYQRKGILLQKWNNIVINYNGGTLDVFYNGELVKSAIEVVPEIKKDMLTVGTNNGIIGSVANVLYFDHQLNYLTVNRLYTMLKNKNPPSISTIDETLIPLPKTTNNQIQKL